jgi:hypothetical protein
MHRAFLIQVVQAPNKHLHSLQCDLSTWSALKASKPANVAHKVALEGAAKRRKAQRPPDENTPGSSRQGAGSSKDKKKQKVAESQSLENSKTANRKARERRAQEQAWSCARKAATRAAQNFSRRHVADFRASHAQRMCEGGLESECFKLGAEVEKAARAAYLNHLQVPFE